MVYGTPSNSLGMRRYEFLSDNPARKFRSGPTSLYRSALKVSTKHYKYRIDVCTFEENPSKKIKYEVHKEI
jgi:hypothetical protein